MSYYVKLIFCITNMNLRYGFKHCEWILRSFFKVNCETSPVKKPVAKEANMKYGI